MKLNTILFPVMVTAMAWPSVGMANIARLVQSVYDEAVIMFDPLPEADSLIAEYGYTQIQIDLGQRLYFDGRVSLDGTISCASCHSFELGGADGMPTSIGHDGAVGPRNAPSVFNAVLNVEQFWDGRAPDLAAQAKGPVENPGEMANSAENLVHTLSEIPGYLAMFSDAFPNDENPVSFDNFATAVAAYETTLITPSKFDDFLKGNKDALTLGEIVGLETFLELGCAECHNGTNMGGNSFQYFGAVRDPETKYRPIDDTGLAQRTSDANDRYVFRVPSLRNITQTGPYFHSGGAESLEEAIQVMANVQLGAKLSRFDVELIIEFLETLTGNTPNSDGPEPFAEPLPMPELQPDPMTLLGPWVSFGRPAG